jgi:drug/metabolite transporter (DMT)-like permease
MLWRKEMTLGTILVIGSAVAYSLSGYFTRVIAGDIWTILFWRGIFAGAFIGICVVLQPGGGKISSLRRMGRDGFWVTLFSTVATICYIAALKLIPVAEVMTVHATLPFVTAILGCGLVSERESWTTWVAALVALGGVAVIFDPSADTDHWYGYGLAILMVFAYGAMLVFIRKNRDVSMLPAACLSAFLCAAIVFPLSSPFSTGPKEMIELFLFGTVQFGGGLLLMTWGARMISAPRAALIGSIENPLAPLWVWLAFNEQPSLATCVGGSIVMAAVFSDILIKSLRSR